MTLPNLDTFSTVASAPSPPIRNAIILVQDVIPELTVMGDRSLLERAIDEASSIGCTNIILTCPPKLEAVLDEFCRRRQQTELQVMVHPHSANGMGHMVHTAKNGVMIEDKVNDNGVFAVILPRDLIMTEEGPNALQQMVEAYQGGMMIGMMKAEDTPLFRGRWILPPEAMERLDRLVKKADHTKGVEMRTLIEQLRDRDEIPIHAVNISGTYFDCSNTDNIAPAQLYSIIVTSETGTSAQAEQELRKFYPTWANNVWGEHRPMSVMLKNEILPAA